MAQQADLARIQKDLETRIAKISQEKKALQGEVEEAKAAIAESKKLLAQQNSEMKDLFRARAEIRQQLKALREADLSLLSGEIEKIDFRLGNLQKALEEQKTATEERLQTVETQVGAQGEHLATQDSRVTALIQQVDTDTQALNQHMTEFQESLNEFKNSLAAIGDGVVKETERATRAEGELRQQVEQVTQMTTASLEEAQGHLEASVQQLQSHLDQTLSTIRTELESKQAKDIEQLRQDVNLTSTNLGEVSQSLATLKAAVEKSDLLLGQRLDEQGDRLADLEVQRQTLADTVAALQTEMNHMASSVQEQQRPIIEQVETLKVELQDLGMQVQADSTQIQELQQTALQLREAQDVMGSLLGKRGDNLIQQAARLEERLKSLETHQEALDKTIDTNRQNMMRHLEELTASLTSTNETVQQSSNDLVARIDAQEQTLNDLVGSVQQLQTLRTALESEHAQRESTNETVLKFRDALQQVTNRLAELENHQAGLTGKLDADAQAISNQFAEIHDALTSEKEALATISAQLHARIDEQERHLNQALKTVQAVKGNEETAKTNVDHLNRLTESMNQLRNVVTTISTKLGERVDQHEERLSELAKRVNRFHASQTKKKK